MFITSQRLRERSHLLKVLHTTRLICPPRTVQRRLKWILVINKDVATKRLEIPSKPSSVCMMASSSENFTVGIPANDIWMIFVSNSSDGLRLADSEGETVRRCRAAASRKPPEHKSAVLCLFECPGCGCWQRAQPLSPSSWRLINRSGDDMDSHIHLAGAHIFVLSNHKGSYNPASQLTLEKKCSCC